MEQEIFKRLDAIALKLGATVDYLWPALVWHERVVGIVQVLVGAALLVAYAALVRFCIRWYRIESTKPRDGDTGFAVAVAGMASLFLPAISLPLIGFGLVSALAPEAEALATLLEALK